MKPKVSIIMAVYNEIDYVEETIMSILNQDFTDWEFIIMIDSLDDKIISLVKEITKAEPRIKLYFNENNLGLTKSLNLAISTSLGEYIARIDADDIAHKNRIRIQNDFLDNNPNISIVGSWARLINEEGKITGTIKTSITNKEISNELLFKNQIIHPSVMIRKSVFDEYGTYNEKILRSQDYDLWLRLRKKVEFHNIDQFLLDYRKHSSSITQNNNIQQRVAGIEMMHNFFIKNKHSLSFKEKYIVTMFFLKQFYKIIRLMY